MTNDEINWIKALDPDCTNGTIQSVLLIENIADCSFVPTVLYLLTATLQENSFLRKQNIELSRGMFNAEQ